MTPTPDAISSPIHIGIVVPDIKVYDVLRKHSYLLSHQQDVRLHVILAEPGLDEQGQMLRFALVNLDMVDPSVARLTYPALQLGWTDEPR